MYKVIITDEFTHYEKGGVKNFFEGTLNRFAVQQKKKANMEKSTFELSLCMHWLKKMLLLTIKRV